MDLSFLRHASTEVSGTPSLLIQLESVDKTTLSRNKYGAV